MKILFVCLGNICRSPMADGIMRHMAKEQQLEYEVDSAGLGEWHIGKAPDPRTIEIAKTNGVDISELRARKFTKDDFKDFDRIYAMDLKNLEHILSLAESEEDKKKVELFFEASMGKKEGVRDPWRNDELFSPVFDEVWEACEALLKKLNTNSASVAK